MKFKFTSELRSSSALYCAAQIGSRVLSVATGSEGIQKLVHFKCSIYVAVQVGFGF